MPALLATLINLLRKKPSEEFRRLFYFQGKGR